MGRGAENAGWFAVGLTTGLCAAGSGYLWLRRRAAPPAGSGIQAVSAVATQRPLVERQLYTHPQRTDWLMEVRGGQVFAWPRKGAYERRIAWGSPGNQAWDELVLVPAREGWVSGWPYGRQ